jgi:hypothetical protein
LPDSGEPVFIVDSGTESFIDYNLLDNGQKIERDDNKGWDHNQQNRPAHGRKIPAYSRLAITFKEFDFFFKHHATKYIYSINISKLWSVTSNPIFIHCQVSFTIFPSSSVSTLNHVFQHLTVSKSL